jgi:DNA-binding transcriptional MerR regulator
MIRSYTVTEVEEMCGVSRRTISEYIAKGLLSGPSHRGRGARYPQSDVDVLRLLPKFRTLMKREFPNLNALAIFLRQISGHDLHVLTKRNGESSFILEVRRLRIRNYLAALAPHVAPERIESILDGLSEGQIRAIDSGRYQIGAVVDISALLQEQPKQSMQAAANGHDSRNGNSHSNQQLERNTEASWSASWLNGGQSERVNGNYNGLGSEDVDELTAVLSRIERKAASTNAELRARLANSATQYGTDFDDTRSDLLTLANNDGASMTSATANLGERLNDISQRLERLEAILEYE